MSTKSPETDAPAFGVYHVTVVPTNFRKEAPTADRGRERSCEDGTDDADAE